MSQASYRHIQEEVLRRIRSHEWAPGDFIPSETILAAEFDCARATVNRALRELAETGIIDRRRKAGTRVSLNPVRKATLDIPITRLEIEGRGQTYRYRLLTRKTEIAPAHLAARMSLPEGGEVFHLTCLHLADERPFLFEDRYVNLAEVPRIQSAPLDQISANEWLVQNVPISSGDISLEAQGATGADAAALGVSPGTALFVIERQTFIGQKTITQVRLAYAPGYRLSTHI